MEYESVYRITIRANDELIDISPDLETTIKEHLGKGVIVEVDAEFMGEEKLN